ncbi:hypothetical protein [Yokenella regensburgei]|uniref:hypothetical protein n=1 Tax=Yokenella regensburgei TaxID=158877 RepID=UPI0031D3DEC5
MKGISMGYFDNDDVVTLKNVVEIIGDIENKLSDINSTISEMETLNRYHLLEHVEAIKAHAHSADHGIYTLIKSVNILGGLPLYQLIQTILLALIAWRLF